MVSLETNAAQLNHRMAQRRTKNSRLEVKDEPRPTNSKRVHRNRQSAMVGLPSSQASGIQL